MSVTAVPIRPLKKGSVVKLWLGMLLLLALAVAAAWLGTRSFQLTTTASGLRFQVIEEGEGPTVTPADLVALHYELRLEDGTVLQNSEESGQPMVTGTQGLFPGFAEGLQMMRAGGTYRLWVPPSLAFQGPIPPGAPFDADDTLIFKVRVLQIAPGMAAMQQQMMGSPAPGGEGEAPASGASAPEPGAGAAQQ
nr:FKBP-type peptidyl-prolyl cis-trans isomerase [Pseudomonadota bacterium]